MKRLIELCLATAYVNETGLFLVPHEQYKKFYGFLVYRKYSVLIFFNRQTPLIWQTDLIKELHQTDDKGVFNTRGFLWFNVSTIEDFKKAILKIKSYE